MTSKIDEKWFRLMVDRSGHSLRSFAGAVGIDPSAFLRTLKGKRRLQLDEAERIARVMGQGVEVADVLAHAGVKLQVPGMPAAAVKVVAKGGQAPVGGTVDAVDGSVTFTPSKASGSAAVVALTIEGDPFLSGWHVLCAPGDVSSDIGGGMDAGIVQTVDGKVLLRKIRPAFAKGRYDLGPVFGFGGRENDVEVVGVIPVMGLER
jgi:hypothetical protein